MQGLHYQQFIERIQQAAMWSQIQDRFHLSDAALERIQGWWEDLKQAGPDEFSCLVTDRPAGTTRPEALDGTLTMSARLLLAMWSRGTDPADYDGLAAELVRWTQGNLTHAEARIVVGPLAGYTPISTLRQVVDAVLTEGGWRSVDHQALGVGQDLPKRLSALLGVKDGLVELRRRLAMEAAEEGWTADELAARHNAACPAGKQVKPDTVKRWMDGARERLATEAA